ncbi:hypothetical protein FVE85_6129 [Porphyridium purpureum]|uniref:Uncharacterized protein n=1 Tax=Porphyridium purpureum TaxID=35688 RepID=A0A5J4Z6D0_PORPP|nr:hypothetical protein FVE85_6129 [Porphyridium purpureum]|eukprot:POR4601..scf295_1
MAPSVAGTYRRHSGGAVPGRSKAYCVKAPPPENVPPLSISDDTLDPPKPQPPASRRRVTVKFTSSSPRAASTPRGPVEAASSRKPSCASLGAVGVATGPLDTGLLQSPEILTPSWRKRKRLSELSADSPRSSPAALSSLSACGGTDVATQPGRQTRRQSSWERKNPAAQSPSLLLEPSLGLNGQGGLRMDTCSLAAGADDVDVWFDEEELAFLERHDAGAREERQRLMPSSLSLPTPSSSPSLKPGTCTSSLDTSANASMKKRSRTFSGYKTAGPPPEALALPLPLEAAREVQNIRRKHALNQEARAAHAKEFDEKDTARRWEDALRDTFTHVGNALGTVRANVVDLESKDAPLASLLAQALEELEKSVQRVKKSTNRSMQSLIKQNLEQQSPSDDLLQVRHGIPRLEGERFSIPAGYSDGTNDDRGVRPRVGIGVSRAMRI